MPDQFRQEFGKLCREARETAQRQGFDASMDNLPQKIALIHAEASEALEDYRKDRHDHIGEELADIVIRVMDLAEGIDVDLGKEIEQKIEANKERKGKHEERKI